MEVVEWDPLHLEGFNFNGAGETAKAMVSVAAGKGVAFSVIDKETVIAMGGIVWLWDGVGESWSILTEKVLNSSSKMRFVHRTVKRVIKAFFEDCGGWRLQTSVRCGYPAGQHWVDHLGFEFEGPMRKYGPDGKDYDRYVIVR